MQLNLPTLQSMVGGMVAAAQAAAAALLDLTVGSPGRALLQASAAQWSVQQSNIYRVLSASRLSTSTGIDVDTFIGDYGCPPREPATYATGAVTLSRYVALGSATVLVGTTVRTADASQTYAIGDDATNAAFSATLGTAGGYVLQAGTASVTVPVTATVAGSGGNVVEGAISLFGTAIAGIDVVSNGAPTQGGEPGETDAAVKARFVLWIGSLDKATALAIAAAVASVQAGLTYQIRENVAEDGSTRPGHFVVVVDDGSGAPSAALKASVYAAVDLVRPLCSTFSVQSPAILYVDVALTVIVSSGTKAALVGPVEAAITAYVDTLTVGGTLSLTRVSALAYGASNTIANVTGVALNGRTSDVVAGAGVVIKARSVTVS